MVECLNGYRLKEALPSNLTEFKTPIGVVETLREGKEYYSRILLALLCASCVKLPMS